MTTTTLPIEAVRGRRITLLPYDADSGREYPGVITDISDGIRFRLDGSRLEQRLSSCRQLRYLDQVVAPAELELPMGEFQPQLGDAGFEDYVGVPVGELGDGGDEGTVIVTGNKDQAMDAVRALYAQWFEGLDIPVRTPEAHWAVFTWGDPDSDFAWTWRYATPDTPNAVHVYYLPA